AAILAAAFAASAFTAAVLAATFASAFLGAIFLTLTAFAIFAAGAVTFLARSTLGGLRSHRVGNAELLVGSLAAELDAVVLIDIDDQDLHLVTDAADIADGVDVAGRELADVHQAVAARQDFD